ncbi:MAG: translation elongation factor Ts [Candidatus Saccharimonadales bacterium]
MAITPADIKKLRDKTGAGMMDAKAALEEAKGDEAKAIDVLRKKGQSKAAKRADRSADAGLVEAYIHMGRVGSMVEVNCETDFVAKTDEFKAFVKDVAMQIAAANPEYLTSDDIPKAVVDKEKDIYTSELKDKPEEVQEKIVTGKLEKFYEQVCLYNQLFIKDSEKTIAEYQTELIAKMGENIKIKRFARMELGEQA